MSVLLDYFQLSHSVSHLYLLSLLPSPLLPAVQHSSLASSSPAISLPVHLSPLLPPPPLANAYLSSKLFSPRPISSSLTKQSAIKIPLLPNDVLFFSIYASLSHPVHYLLLSLLTHFPPLLRYLPTLTSFSHSFPRAKSTGRLPPFLITQLFHPSHLIIFFFFLQIRISTFFCPSRFLDLFFIPDQPVYLLLPHPLPFIPSSFTRSIHNSLLIF